MKKIRLYIAISLDGFIAKSDGDINWLHEIPNPEGTDHGYMDFINTIDTVLMGNATYQQVLGFDMPFPYMNTKNYVFTRNTDLTQDKYVTFISEHIEEFTRKLKSESGKDIWLIGGGQVNTTLLNAGLVDELIVFVMPIILGTGIPLFGKVPIETKLKLVHSETYSTGAVGLTYNTKEN